MILRKACAGLIAGLCLLGSLFVPAALADTAQTSATVEVADGGTFTVAFCGAVALTQSSPPTAETPGVATGGLGICYSPDNKSYRSAFTVALSTGAFTSTTTSTAIGPENLSMLATYNVAATHYTGNPPAVPRYGDIGYYVDGHYVAQVNNYNPQYWTADAFKLDTPQIVNFGYAGRGTGGAIGLMQVKLNIPSGTAAGIYQSQLTLTVTMTTP